MSDNTKNDEKTIETEIAPEKAELPEVPAADLDDVSGGFHIGGVKPDDTVSVGGLCITWTKDWPKLT
jgi:hypothetical protein